VVSKTCVTVIWAEAVQSVESLRITETADEVFIVPRDSPISYYTALNAFFQLVWTEFVCFLRGEFSFASHWTAPLLEQFRNPRLAIASPATPEDDLVWERCFVVRRSLVSGLGGFEERFSVSYAPQYLAWRCRARGFETVRVPTPGITAESSAATRERESNAYYTMIGDADLYDRLVG
jgi:GT2 family glycosyltransferase